MDTTFIHLRPIQLRQESGRELDSSDWRIHDTIVCTKENSEASRLSRMDPRSSLEASSASRFEAAPCNSFLGGELGVVSMSMPPNRRAALLCSTETSERRKPSRAVAAETPALMAAQRRHYQRRSGYRPRSPAARNAFSMRPWRTYLTAPRDGHRQTDQMFLAVGEQRSLMRCAPETRQGPRCHRNPLFDSRAL